MLMLAINISFLIGSFSSFFLFIIFNIERLAKSISFYFLFSFHFSAVSLIHSFIFLANFISFFNVFLYFFSFKLFVILFNKFPKNNIQLNIWMKINYLLRIQKLDFIFFFFPKSFFFHHFMDFF